MKRWIPILVFCTLFMLLLAFFFIPPPGTSSTAEALGWKPSKGRSVKRTLFATPKPFRPSRNMPPAAPFAPIVTPEEPDAGIVYVSTPAPPEGIQPTVWPVTQDGVRGALLEQMPLIRDCYDDALKEIPDLAGTMTVLFTIQRKNGIGQVTAADLLEDNLRDGPTEECVLGAVGSLQFDPPSGEGYVVVTWPFHFETRETPSMPEHP